MSFSGVDETRTCRDCKCEFIFTAGEQIWLAERVTDPKPPNRCKKCRDENKAKNQSRNVDGGRFNTSGGYNSGSSYQQPTTPNQSAMPAERPPHRQYVQPVVEHRNRTDRDKIDRDEGEDRRGKRDRKQRRNRNDFDDFDF
jgi:hypothetical protein